MLRNRNHMWLRFYKSRSGSLNVVTPIPIFCRYNLTKYTSEKVDGKKVAVVDIPEEVFADWLTDYRIKSTRKEEPENNWP